MWRLIGRAFRFARGPFHRPLEPLLWLASVVSVRRAWALPSTAKGTTNRAAMDARLAAMHPARRALPLLAVIAQWRVDGARWQVVPAYIGTGLTMSVSAAGTRLPLWIRRVAAFSGGATTFASVISGLLIPVFRMPKPTGPYKVGKRTMLWADKSRKSWLLNTKGRGALPEHRKLMANVWYPACERGLSELRTKRKANWLDPLLARSLAVSFWAPEWCVNYFRLVRMEALDNVPISKDKAFPVVLFSHSFTGMKEQNSALFQEMASWGYIIVAVDHPHDAALVLYPDGSTADFRGYDMPNDALPLNWWKFRHEHLRWRALDVLFALEQMVNLNDDPESNFYQSLDLTRIAAMGHSFGGAAVGLVAQMDPRIQCCIMLDPWMWPFGLEKMKQGIPCPLLIFEAPRFIGNRDIFCVSNSEMTSTLCASTAPASVNANVEEKEPFQSTPARLDHVDEELDKDIDEDIDAPGSLSRHGSESGRSPRVSTNSLNNLRPPIPPRRSVEGGPSSSVEKLASGAPLAHSSMSRNSSWGSFASTYAAQREPSGVAFKAVIEETMHFDFTDLAMVAPLTTRLLGVVAVGGYEVHDITGAAILRFLHAYNHPREFDHILSAEELDSQARAIHPGPWPGCPVDAKQVNSVGGAATSNVVPPSPRSTPLKTLREELRKQPDSGWEAKGGICRWVQCTDWLHDEERPWIDEQSREIRWLLSETEDKGVALTDADLTCMFPTRSVESIRAAIAAYRSSDEVFPTPKKLGWLSEALLGGDIDDAPPDYEGFRP